MCASAVADDAQVCEGTTSEVVAACTRLIESRTRQRTPLASLYLSRSLGWQSGGDDDRAIADYAEEARIDPGNIGAFNNLCSRYSVRGEYMTAVSYCDKAIALDPKYAPAYQNRCSAYGDNGDYDLAIA